MHSYSNSYNNRLGLAGLTTCTEVPVQLHLQPLVKYKGDAVYYILARMQSEYQVQGSTGEYSHPGSCTVRIQGGYSLYPGNYTVRIQRERTIIAPPGLSAMKPNRLPIVDRARLTVRVAGAVLIVHGTAVAVTPAWVVKRTPLRTYPRSE